MNDSISQNQARRLRTTVASTILVAAALCAVALHAPGEMSVDSILALYGSMKHAAVGWDVTYLSAILAWLGGGTVATSLFIAANSLITYGCFVLLLTRPNSSAASNWRYILAFLLAVNPLFMFYTGIVWKDVLLASLSILAGTLILLATESHGRRRIALSIATIIVAAFMTPVRQQAFLIAIPLMVAAAELSTAEFHLTRRKRISLVVGAIVVGIGFAMFFTGLQNLTIKSKHSRQISLGLIQVRDYDITGIIAYSRRGRSEAWTMATPQVIRQIRRHYRPERIGSIWQNKIIRDYLRKLQRNGEGWKVWMNGVLRNPLAYLHHRASSLSYLLGLRAIKGCVPAYWGVYGLPMESKALGLKNGMSERAKFVGRMSVSLYPTPIFRNWVYGILLLLETIFLIRYKMEYRFVAITISISAWLYMISYFPITIACDFRFLYPVAALATVLAIFILTGGREMSSTGAKRKYDEDVR